MLSVEIINNIIIFSPTTLQGDLASLALKALAAEGGGLEKFLAMNMRIHAEEEMLARKLSSARKAKHRGNEREEEAARELKHFYQVIDPVLYKVLYAMRDPVHKFTLRYALCSSKSLLPVTHASASSKPHMSCTQD